MECFKINEADVIEVNFNITGRTISGIRRSNSDEHVTLFLHGWLDNCSSFLPIVRHTKLVNFVAVDMAGHGRSDHRGKGAEYNLADYVQDVYDLVTSHKWRSINIVGHSLGGIVGSIFCACFPEMVNKLVCIETAGPLSEPESSTVLQLRESVKSRLKALGAEVKQPHDMEQIVRSRMKVSDLTDENARMILKRNTLSCSDNSIRWTTDHRLRTKSSIRFTESQACDVVSNIQCPTLIIIGTRGFEKVKNNLNARKHLFKTLDVKVIDGGHHVHMDSPEEVTNVIECFLSS